MIKKVKEKMLKENDVYFLEVVSNRIIINNNYEGIIILNDDFRELKRFNILEQMMIYSCYIKGDDKELLLFCAENECLVYVSLYNYDYKVIDLSNYYSDVLFSPVYLWDSNILVLSTYKGEFYNIDVKMGAVNLISNKDVSEKYSHFYKFWLETKAYKNLVNIQSNYFRFMFKNDMGKYYLCDSLNNKRQIIDYLDDISHEVNFEENIFAFTSEKSINIVKQNAEVDRIEMDNTHIFLRTRFLKNALFLRIVVLSTSKSDSCENLITMYDI